MSALIAAQDLRRSNLRRILSERFEGNIAALARAAEKTPPLFSDILSDPPRKGFGERLARSIEERLDLPKGWLDSGEPVAIDPAFSLPQEMFLLAIRSALKKRDVPAHAMQTVLMLLDACPAKIAT